MSERVTEIRALLVELRERQFGDQITVALDDLLFYNSVLRARAEQAEARLANTQPYIKRAQEMQAERDALRADLKEARVLLGTAHSMLHGIHISMPDYPLPPWAQLPVWLEDTGAFLTRRTPREGGVGL